MIRPMTVHRGQGGGAVISQWAFYGLLLLAGLTGAIGDILLAKWAKEERAA